MRIVFDAASTKSARRIDENGFLHVTGCPITSFGVFDYARSEAQLPGDPNEIVKVLRAKEVISNEYFLASCQNLPIIDDHTYIEGITQDSDGLPDVDEGVDPDKKGVCGVMVNLRFDEESGWCIADLVFYSRTMIRLIMSGKKVELSLGFVCDFIPTEGEVAAEQVDMRGNHLALVGKARVPGARVLDSAFPQQTSEEDQMKNKRIGDSAVEKLRELIPALQQFLAEEAKEPEHQEGASEEASGEVETDEAKAAREAAEAAAASEAAVDPEEQTGDEEAGNADDQVTSLLKQLIAILSGGESAAAGDEQVEASAAKGNDDPAQIGDGEDGDEQIANESKGTVTMDAMFQAVAERDALYSRVSKHVGAFDHAAMTTGKVAEYAVKKLGIKCAVGDSAVALNAYMDGVEATAAKAKTAIKQRTGDGAVSSSELDAYLNPQK